jgi:hypothetical protein
MRASRTIDRLVHCYPPSWRARYGEELKELVTDMTEGRRVPWRLRVNVVAGGARERLRATGVLRDGPAPDRVRAGAVLVMWAWALFVVGGAILAKSTEHWQLSTPAGDGHAVASAAFNVLILGAICVGVVVLAGIALTIPSVPRLLREGGWSRIRQPILVAAWLSAVLVAATIGLVVWAHGLTPNSRNGHNTAYAIGFLIWAVLCASALLAWTAAASATAQQVRLATSTLRAEAWLASMAALGMIMMVAATLVWWVVVGNAAPSALTGGPDTGHASVIVPGLVVATVSMLLATALGIIGARTALNASAALPSEPGCAG